MTDAEANARWFAEQFDWVYWERELEEEDDYDDDRQHLEDIEEQFIQEEARRKKKLYEMFASVH